MSQKKCPKCGEMNPAEAVMCWACYTPLTAGAVAGGGTAAMAATPVTTAEKKEKKAVEPWQIGVVAVAVVLALGFGVSQMMGSSGGEGTTDNVAGPIPKPPRTSGRDSGPSPDPFTGTLTVPAPGGGAGTSMKIADVVEYDVVSPPNPDLQWGVVGLAAKDPNVSSQRAAGMATFAHQQFGGQSKWKAMQIFVFKTREAATQFNRFQIGRKYDVVADDDYPGLAALWPNCIVRYEVNGNGAPDIRFPSKSPNGWWRGAAR